MINAYFFFKKKTAYEMRISDGVQTCALPIYPAVCHDGNLEHLILLRAEIELNTARIGMRFLTAHQRGEFVDRMSLREAQQVVAVHLRDVGTDHLQLGPPHVVQPHTVYGESAELPVDLCQVVGFAHPDAG